MNFLYSIYKCHKQIFKCGFSVWFEARSFWIDKSNIILNATLNDVIFSFSTPAGNISKYYCKDYEGFLIQILCAVK